MTDVCGLVYPADDVDILASSASKEDLVSRHRVAKARLNEWSQKAGEKLRGILDATETESHVGSDSVKHVILQANLLRLYYQ